MKDSELSLQYNQDGSLDIFYVDHINQETKRWYFDAKNKEALLNALLISDPKRLLPKLTQKFHTDFQIHAFQEYLGYNNVQYSTYDK